MQYPKPPAFHLAQSTITPALFSRQSKPHLAFHTAGSCQNIIVIIEKKPSDLQSGCKSWYLREREIIRRRKRRRGRKRILNWEMKQKIKREKIGGNAKLWKKEILHFQEVNMNKKKIGNKSWKILNMACVQYHKSSMVSSKDKYLSSTMRRVENRSVRLTNRWRSRLKGNTAPGRSGKSPSPFDPQGENVDACPWISFPPFFLTYKSSSRNRNSTPAREKGIHPQ